MGPAGAYSECQPGVPTHRVADVDLRVHGHIVAPADEKATPTRVTPRCGARTADLAAPDEQLRKVDQAASRGSGLDDDPAAALQLGCQLLDRHVPQHLLGGRRPGG